MKKIKLTKENIPVALILLLSFILNFVNLGIEGTANSYYAAAAKSMSLNLKNFFFVSFDPTAFVSIDKPPLGFWFQAISVKIFGFNSYGLLIPQALFGLLSVFVLYKLVKRSFGKTSGIISALCLAVTPVFVAVSRNNSVDNTLVFFLLLSCYALSIAAEKGKFKYLLISMVLLGIGFNVKMLQAYMIGPALYITYLLSTKVSFKKRILHLVIGSIVLIAVSLSWALIVDSTSKSSRPYVDSSTNNTVMELITGHNGIERLSLGSSSKGGNGGPSGSGGPGGAPSGKMGGPNSSDKNFPGNPPNQNGTNSNNMGYPPDSKGQNGTGSNNMGYPPEDNNSKDNNSQNSAGSASNNTSKDSKMTPPNGMGGGNMGGGPGGTSSNLQGTFGGQVKASITRLFSKNILSDQIVWFIPLAIFGFIAGAIKEKLRFFLDSSKKQQLVMWFMWFLPCFIYFSYNTGTFHSYYLTMLAPPTAALTGIGLVAMWEMYNEGKLTSWLLPIALMADGIVQLIMLYYFIDSALVVKVLIVIVIVLCFISSILLAAFNFKKNVSIKTKKSLVILALIGLLITPFVGSSLVLFNKLNGSFPAAGLELLSGSAKDMGGSSKSGNNNMDNMGGTSTKLIEFLKKNKTKNQKYLLVVSNANSGADIIINSNESVMCLGGFLGNNKPLTLSEFKSLVLKGEVRYVMTGGQGNSNSEIMSWVKKNGTLVSSSEYSNASSKDTANSSDVSSNANSTSSKNDSKDSDNSMNQGGPDGASGQLYDLKAYTDSNK